MTTLEFTPEAEQEKPGLTDSELAEIHRAAVAKADPVAREVASIGAQMFTEKKRLIAQMRESDILEDNSNSTRCPNVHAVENIEVGNDIAA